MIGGFIITGNEPKRVLIRAIAPSIGMPGTLTDPVLALHGADGSLIVRNDNWKDTQQAQISKTTIAPENDLESAIVARLSPGLYTAIVSGHVEERGVALLEIYDLDRKADSELANISTRGFARKRDNVLIGGFLLGPSEAGAKVIVRALGPSLATRGVENVLADPTLDVRDANGTRLIFNDNWRDDPAQAAEITAAGLAPTRRRESAVSMTLPKGTYTAIVAGNDGAVGIGLVEIYNVQ